VLPDNKINPILEVLKMKKSIISVSGLALVLIGAIVFNVVKYEQTKTRYCVIAKYFWGHNIEQLCKGGEHNGCNRIYACTKSTNKHRYGATIGNTSKEWYTWHIDNNR
jgi:hypothetical protein